MRVPRTANPLWTPGNVRAAQSTLELFSTWMSSRAGKPLRGCNELYRYTGTNSSRVVVRGGTSQKCQVTKAARRRCATPGQMPRAQVFPNGTLNLCARAGPRDRRCHLLIAGAAAARSLGTGRTTHLAAHI